MLHHCCSSVASDEVALSVDELARQMGYGRHILWADFPDLCNQVSVGCSTARRKHHEERMATICSEIGQAALLFHKQSTRPFRCGINKILPTKAIAL